jgi:hypothetical protein
LDLFYEFNASKRDNVGSRPRQKPTQPTLQKKNWFANFSRVAVTPGRNFPQKFEIKSDLAVIAPFTVITLNGNSEEICKDTGAQRFIGIETVSLAWARFLV